MPVIKDIPVKDIEDPILVLHPEPDTEYLKELALSIRETGQQQEIVVRRRDNKYQLIIGYCRTEAARLYGIPTLRARIIECNDAEAMIMSATENIHRLEQDPISEGKLFQKLIKSYGLSKSAIAQRFGKSIAYINSRLALLKLKPEVARLVTEQRLPIGLGVQVARLEKREDQIIAAADFMKHPTTVEHAAAIIDSFLSLSPEDLKRPTVEQIEKAREEVKIECHFCNQLVPYEKVKGYNMCINCYHGAMYLFEKERREGKK